MKETFPPCPPAIVQWRAVGCALIGNARTLWRTETCYADRWHYIENPCNCGPYWRHKPTLDDFRSQLGYGMEGPVFAETGTWRRDGQYIASQTAKFREQIRATREQATIARAAAGPQRWASQAWEPLACQQELIIDDLLRQYWGARGLFGYAPP